MRFLRPLGFFLLSVGFMYLLLSALSCGMPYMGGGKPNATMAYGGLAAMATGVLCLFTYFFFILATEGWAAAGFTLGRLILYSIASGVAWWFLCGPKANSYPRAYGLGTFILALAAGSLLLPLFKKKRP